MKDVNYQPLSPLSFLERSARAYGNKVAIIDKNICKTYQEFLEDCIFLANAFKGLGLQAEDKVAYLCRNNFQMLEAYYAVPMFGGILVPINIRLSSLEVSHILKHSEAKILVIEEQYLDVDYLDIVQHMVIIPSQKRSVKSAKMLDYADLIQLGKNADVHVKQAEINENSIITINYTSGTTGVPKGVMYSHRSTYLNSLGECLEVGLSKNSRYLWVLPMFHCNGWCFTWAVTAAGATHICMDSFDSEKTIELIHSQNITHLCAAPTVLVMLAEAKNFNSLQRKANLTIVTAGASPSPSLIQKYKELGILLVHVYGLTETHGPHLICEEQHHWNDLTITDFAKLKALQGVSYIHSVYTRVVDKNFEDVPHDGITLGEVVMRGNNVMLGYYKDPASTERAFKNGWFNSGDLAVMHPNGYIEIKDRKKDIIVSGGENIPSIEVENVIYRLPEVLAVAVIPKLDVKWGEVPHAVVELKEGRTLSQEQIIFHCRSHLTHFKCPKSISFKKIPKTSTGKIQKYILKKSCNEISSNATGEL